MIQTDRVNQLNRMVTETFTNAMQKLKPKKNIQILKNENITRQQKIIKSYEIRLKEWQSAFRFRKELREYLNELHNILVLADGPNSSIERNPFTIHSFEALKIFMKSDNNKKSFKEYMDDCIPKEITSNSERNLEIWNKEFDYPIRLEKFISSLEEQIRNDNRIPADRYMIQIDDFIRESNINEDEFLLKETENIGGQEFTVNTEAISTRAEKESEDLRKEIISNSEIISDSESKTIKKIKENFSNSQQLFKKVIKDAKKNQLEVKAEKKILEKKYDNAQTKFEIDTELIKKGAHAVKKNFPQYMNVIAGGSIVVILGLVAMSLLCIQCSEETILTEETSSIDPITKKVQKDSVIDTRTEVIIRNPATEILESEIIVILISTFVAPVATRVIKEKFDIDITEKQINMVMQDGIKSVTMFAKEADKLRDPNGHIPRKYQKTLRDKAFTTLRENYTGSKYRDVAANVGGQMFEKAIESAVTSGKLEKFPLEKKQVEELIKQSIDATPAIVEWQKLDEKAKNIFIDGNIRKLLQNTGINGWSYKALENIFDAEANKRLVNAALIGKDSIIEQLDAQDPYLKYTSTVIDAVLERKSKSS